MQISKWGNSLAVRLPAALIEMLGLKEGDDIELYALGERTFGVERALSLDERLEVLRRSRGKLRSGFRFDRDETHER
jgi:antitoxin MazE